MEYQMLSSIDTVTYLEKQSIVDFLYEHLDAYRDKKDNILKALDYAVSDFVHQGGFVMLAKDDDEILGAVVMNKTGMEGYIPENVLVYVATHRDYRNQGIARELLNRSIKMANGDIALHIEPDNPAINEFKRAGFIKKYIEMRLYKHK